MPDQVVDYTALADQARQTPPPTAPTQQGTTVDYSGLADQARLSEQEANPANEYLYTLPGGLKVYRTPGAPVFQEAPQQKEASPMTPTEALFTNPAKQFVAPFFSAAAGANRLTANIAGMLNNTVAATGLPKADVLKHIEDWAREQQRGQEQTAADLSGGRQDIPSQVFRGAGNLVFGAPAPAVAATAGTMLGGPVGGAAALGALGGAETADEGWKNALIAAAQNAATGGALTVMGPASRPLRLVAAAAMTYAQLRLDGVPHETALANALGMGGASALHPGGLGVRDIAQLPLTPRLLKPSLTPQAAASQAYLTSRGIETPLSMQTGSKAAENLEGTIQNLPGGGSFGERMQASKQKLTEAGQQELTRISPQPATKEQAGTAVQSKLASDLQQARTQLAGKVSPTAATPESAGTKVIERGKAVIRQYDQAADQAYKKAAIAERDPRNFEDIPTGEIDDEGNQVTERMALPIDMGQTQAALKPLIARYEYTLPETDLRASKGLKALRNIVNGPRYKPASAAEMDLGMLKEASRSEMPELRDQSQGLAAKAVAELQDAIDAKFGQASYPGWDGSGVSPALEHLQAGRKATAQKHEVADVYKGFGRNIEELEPVGAFRRLTWEGDTGIGHLRDVAKIAPDAMPDVGRAFIDSGGKWPSLGPETKKILFRDPKVIKDLDAYYDQHAKVAPLLKLDPVGLVDRLTGAGGRRLSELRDVSKQAPKEMPRVFRSYIEGLLDKVTREGDLQKVQGVLDDWLDMDPESKRLLAGDGKKGAALINDLNSLFFSLKRMARNPNPSGSGFIMALTKMKGDIFKGLGLIGAGGAGAATHGGMGATLGAGTGLIAGAGLEYGSNAALARLLFNDKFRRLLTEGLKMDMRGDTGGAGLTARTIAKLIPDEEPPAGTAPESSGGTPPAAPGGGQGRPAVEDLFKRGRRSTELDSWDREHPEEPPEEPPATPPGGTPAAPAQAPSLGEKIKGAVKKFWEEEEGSLTLPNLRKADRAAGSEQSTRVPTAVKATEDPLSNILTTGYKSWLRDPEMLRKNVNAMLDYPNFRDLQAQVKSGKLSIPDAAEKIVGRIQENLQWLHDSMPENFRDRARLWYDGAHTIARKWAGDYGATKEQVAASMAVTSPGTDWFVNAERARRLLEFWQDRGSKKWDPRMETTWRDKISKAVPEQARDQIYQLIKGKSFKQVAKDPDVAPIWFRLYDEAVNPREYPTLTPEGKAGDLARVGSGDPRQFSWSDFGQIRKTLSILEDGSRENIHEQLGKEHKVRNFYNNIINPDSPREHTTIDTHAVAAALVRPLSQMSTEVGHNFGGAGSSSSSVSGESGTYGLHKEAYRRAAAANGLLPREMQSITWEAIRSMFSPAFKRNPANVEYINSLWQDVSSGKITADAARQRALQFAGGFDRPAWFKGRWNPAVPKAAKPSSKSR